MEHNGKVSFIQFSLIFSACFVNLLSVRNQTKVTKKLNTAAKIICLPAANIKELPLHSSTADPTEGECKTVLVSCFVSFSCFVSWTVLWKRISPLGQYAGSQSRKRSDHFIRNTFSSLIFCALILCCLDYLYPQNLTVTDIDKMAKKTMVSPSTC